MNMLKETRLLLIKRSVYNKAVRFANERIDCLNNALLQSAKCNKTLNSENICLREKLAKFDRKQGKDGKFVKKS